LAGTASSAGTFRWAWERRFEVKAVGKFMADANGRLANWKDLSKPCTVVGTITSTDTQSGGNGAIRTAYFCDDLPVNDFEAGIFIISTAAYAPTADADFGARDETNGITMTAWHAAANKMAAGCAGSVVTDIAATTDWNGVGIHSVCRKNATEFEAYKGPVKKATIANTAAPLPHLQIYAMGQNQNGTVAPSTSQHSGWFLGHALTDAQRYVLHAAMMRLHQKMSGGDVDDQLPGYQPQNVTEYDYLVWGTTLNGAAAVYELKRQGKTVCPIGDRFDRRWGGMTTGGLGHMDSHALTSNQGLVRWMLRQCQDLEGKPAIKLDIQPRTMERVIQAMFDPTKPNGLDVPVFWSDGILSAFEDATGITIVTVDGRTFRGKRWLDCSDENTLVRALGITTTTMREAAGSGIDANNGVRAPVNEFFDHTGATMVIDPFVIPGVPASGLVAGVHGFASDLTVGAASPDVQGFNERIPVTDDPSILIPFPTTPPRGYSAATYELLGRQLALDPTIDLRDLFNLYGPIATTRHGHIYDLNNGPNAFSTDYLGDASANYIVGTYAQKAAIRLEIRNYMLGLFYYLQHDPDPRVPAALRTEARAYGMVSDHFCDPDWAAGEMPHWPNRTYVREPARLVSDFILTGEDCNTFDGTVPRSIKTISTITYPLDSHYVKRYAYDNNGTWETRVEGGFFVKSGGMDKTTPLPYEVCVPRRSESTRGLVGGIGLAVNHVAMGGARMELTAGQTSQSCACALMIAEEQGIDVQDVDYATLRARILATPTLTNETEPYLPQLGPIIYANHTIKKGRYGEGQDDSADGFEDDAAYLNAR
jgi:hypothetical protein